MYPTQEGSTLESSGFFGMCDESIKIISSYKKIFLQITLTLVLPLSTIFFCHTMISIHLTSKIINELDENFNLLFLQYIKYLLTEVIYFTFLAIFSLLSTSIVVYTVACIYSRNQTTYKRVMGFIPKVWNMLLITLLCTFSIFIVYNILASLTLVTFLSFYSENDTKLARMMLLTVYILYYISFLYICAIWQLASVISVLEGIYGLQAITRGNALFKSKMGISVIIFIEVNLSLGCISTLFDDSVGVVWKIGFGGFFLMLRSLVFMFGLVVQTVIYFVCESRVDNSALYNLLDVDLGDYVPLDPKDAKTEQV